MLVDYSYYVQMYILWE